MDGDYPQFLRKAQDALKANPEAVPLSIGTIEAYGLGIYERDPDKPLDITDGLAAVVPIGMDGAKVFDTTDRRYSTVGEVGPILWGADALEVSGPVAVCMDLMDALSLRDQGAPALCVNQPGIEILRERVRKETPRGTLVIVPHGPDSYDEPYRELARGLREVNPGVEVLTFAFDQGEPTPYDALVSRGPGAVLELIGKIAGIVEDGEQRAREEYDGQTIANRIPAFLDYIRKPKGKPIPTGFDSLDRTLDGGLNPGLYVIGANSSLGKTTLALQIADNVAQSGQDVLIFSVEQSANELVAKSLSRISFLKSDGLRQGQTARSILNRFDEMDPMIQDLIVESADFYRDLSRTLHIIEGDDSRGIDDDRVGLDTIRTAVDRHIELTGRKPVVFIDYLQILFAPNDPTGRKSTKQNIDEMVSELRRMTRPSGYDIPIFLISSKNRGSYTGSNDMGGFKESGLIEYSADVVMELYPEGLSQKETPTGKKADVDTLKETRSNAERMMILEVSKNRMGIAHKGLRFRYNARFNLFEEVPELPDPGEGETADPYAGYSQI